jgi:3',5'-cyclic AMP phosphodiesterase CpdA
MLTITWLHLSDLHFRADKLHRWNEDVVLHALLDDVAQRIKQDDLRPDFVVVTGDVAFSGKPAEYNLARTFFDDLLQTTSLGTDRLFLVPGNHDVDRKRIGVTAELLGPTLSTRDAINKVLDDAATRHTFMKRFEGYAAFVDDYLGSYSAFNDEAVDVEGYFYTQCLNLAGQQIAILGLNSAWLAQGGEEDRNKLVLGERQVRAALDDAKDADLCIALLHHPFDWLRDFDRADAQALLYDECDFVLHGHMHQVGLLQARTPDSDAFVIAAGACYETRTHTNAYNLVQLDPTTGQGTVYLRTYSDKRGGFWTKDTTNYRNVPDGEYCFVLHGEPVVQQEVEQPVSVTVIQARDGAIAMGDGATALGTGAQQIHVGGSVTGGVTTTVERPDEPEDQP